MICFMKILPFVLFGLSSTGLAAVTVGVDGDKTVYDVRLDAPEFETVTVHGRSFVKARLRGAKGFEGIRFEEGRPELPVVRFVLDGDVQVEVDSVRLQGVIENGLQLRPSQPSWSKSSHSAPGFRYEPDAYSSRRWMSLPEFEIEEVGTYRGIPRRMVTLNAFRYDPSRGVYEVITGYRLTVKTRQTIENRDPQLVLVIGAKFENHPDVRRLAELKRSEGFRVLDVVVGKDVQNSPDEIRKRLQHIYRQGENLRFAILIGDVEDVPAFSSTRIYGVTDHPYRSVDRDDYANDINAPDIGVGRLSVSTDSELTVVVDKIERYLKGDFTEHFTIEGDSSWLRHPAFIATHDRYQVAEATHNHVINEFFKPRDYLQSFPEASGRGGDQLYPVSLGATRRQIVSHMSGGRFIVNFSGHGSHGGWEDVSTQDVLAMNHPSALPWVLSNSCITGDFRVGSVFAETWLRHPHGAIAFWGSMDSSYWDEDDVLEKGAYRAVFERSIRSFDMIHQAGLSEVWRYYGGAGRSQYYWETYVTFADPSLYVRLDLPKNVELEGPTEISSGQTRISWRVTSNGAPVQDAVVVLLGDEGSSSVSARSDKNGRVDLDLSRLPQSPDGLRLWVHGYDLQSVSRDIPVQP